MDPKNKTFDAVTESHKWREATSRKLDAMSAAERVAYLRGVGERYVVEHAARKARRKQEMATAS